MQSLYSLRPKVVEINCSDIRISQSDRPLSKEGYCSDSPKRAMFVVFAYSLLHSVVMIVINYVDGD